MKYAVMVVLILMCCGCGSDEPRDLRTELEKQLAENLKLLNSVSGQNIPNEIMQCAAKAATKSFSDEEVKLIIDSSLSERLSNPQKMMSIQEKMQDERFLAQFVLQCAKDLKSR
ncbi:hypothetical protein [Helicobacter sp. MIT 14-3879]|uniref:hypothetical protein n=1 Tax=Helicobacter sp. MIT 14-3879 TaxID=2040649 RepID=UPI000E1E8AB9|nr:hypothetical protein [Helicobacter sp. MIT 14-3879]RDU61332.1 hypothetical protein CQA44_09340 [Helicobacter sp. MIT 14-3879]